MGRPQRGVWKGRDAASWAPAHATLQAGTLPHMTLQAGHPVPVSHRHPICSPEFCSWLAGQTTRMRTSAQRTTANARSKPIMRRKDFPDSDSDSSGSFTLRPASHKTAGRGVCFLSLLPRPHPRALPDAQELGAHTSTVLFQEGVRADLPLSHSPCQRLGSGWAPEAAPNRALRGSAQGRPSLPTGTTQTLQAGNKLRLRRHRH